MLPLQHACCHSHTCLKGKLFGLLLLSLGSHSAHIGIGVAFPRRCVTLVLDTGFSVMQCTKRSTCIQGSDVLPACRFFAAEGCKLRVGAYTSLHTLCTYLESDVSADGQAERNFWVSGHLCYIPICQKLLPSSWCQLPAVQVSYTGVAD